MTKPLRYILVGTGGWGATWRREVLPRLATLGKAEPAALVDINPESLREAQDQFSLPADKCYADFERAFAETPADFVIVVVPPAHHERVVTAALARKMHILSEKPLADSIDAVCRIYKRVRRARRKMAVTMSHRFDQDKQTLSRAIHDGAYGPLNYLVARFTHNCRRFGDWGDFRHTIPDPLLIEGAVHHFDIFRDLAGTDATEVYAVGWNPPWGAYQGDSTALVTIQMANGVKGLYEGAKANASTMNGWTQEYFRAECQDGTLELDSRRVRVLQGPAWDPPQTQNLPLLEQPAWMNAWLTEMFCDWLRGDRASHPTNLEDNMQCAALLFAAIESAHTHRPVQVQKFLRKHLRAARI